jgi:hypothetical protein
VSSKAYLGYGSTLSSSLDGITYAVVAQLKKFVPAGSKQTMADQTNLRSQGPFTQPLAVQVDTGEFEFDGVYLGDATQLSLGQLHGQMQLAYFKAVLSDGTIWAFVGYVSEFKPFDVTYNKAIAFSGKLRVAGGITPPTGPQI